MDMRLILGKVMGFLVIIITLALAPSIITSNNVIIAHVAIDNFTGMAAVAAFGAPIIILGLLVSGGMFAVAGVKGKLAGVGVKDMLLVIGSIVVVIVGLTMANSMFTYVAALIAADGGTFASVIYGILPIIIYVGIIAGTGYAQVERYRALKGGKGSNRAASANP